MGISLLEGMTRFCRCFKCGLIFNFACLVCMPGAPSKCNIEQEKLWLVQGKEKIRFPLFCL